MDQPGRERAWGIITPFCSLRLRIWTAVAAAAAATTVCSRMSSFTKNSFNMEHKYRRAQKKKEIKKPLMCVCVGLLKNKIKQQLRLGRVLPLTLFRVSTGRHWGKGSNRQSQRARLGIKCCPFPPLSPPPTRSSPQTTIATGFPFHVNILYDPSLFSSSSSLGARVVEEEEEVRHKKKHKPKSGENIHNKRKCFFFSCIVFFYY